MLEINDVELYCRIVYKSHALHVCCRSFTTFSASSELPCDTEATVVLWINKACSVMRARLEQQNATRVRDLMLHVSYYAFKDAPKQFSQIFADSFNCKHRWEHFFLLILKVED